MSKHRKPPGNKSSSGKKQKTERKRELKEKTIAAEIGGVVMREEAAKPEPRPVAEAAKPVPRPAPPREEAAKAVRRPAPEVAKPAPRPVLEAAKAAPRPIQPAVSQAPASKKPLEPRSIPAKPLAAVEPEASPEPKAAESWQRSLDAARLGTVEVNRLLLDIGRRNIASGFELARSLATARTPIEAVQLQLAFFDERMRTLLHQAEALRALSVDLVARANEPIREQLRMKRMTAWWG